MKSIDGTTLELLVLNNWEQTQREASHAISGSRSGTIPISNRRRAVETWDLSRVREYLINRGHMESARADMLIREYRRFMMLLVDHPGEMIPIAGPVDEVWHTHVLFTREYHTFCMATMGEYIHHAPTISDEEANRLLGSYKDNTLRLYRETFGPIDHTIWSENNAVCGCNGTIGTGVPPP
jgi:hypothetical protein